uniref:Uncharacterized protein n=1 Tax=Trichuris muris TaxID=70415 RepID=A0A5S6Q4A6_TRIMR
MDNDGRGWDNIGEDEGSKTDSNKEGYSAACTLMKALTGTERSLLLHFRCVTVAVGGMGYSNLCMTDWGGGRQTMDGSRLYLKAMLLVWVVEEDPADPKTDWAVDKSIALMTDLSMIRNLHCGDKDNKRDLLEREKVRDEKFENYEEQTF